MAAKPRCQVCGSADVTVDTPSEYPYAHCGLSHVILCGDGVTITRCDTCDNSVTVIWKEQQLLQFLGLMLVKSPPGMTGEELRYLRKLFGMTQAEMAEAVSVSRRETIADWEKKDRIFQQVYPEITLRLFLLGLFRKRVIDGEFCFLEPGQVRGYEGFADSFIKYISDLTRAKRTAGKLSVRHRPRQRAWQEDSACV